MQFADTSIPATTKAEKKNKDTSGGATERIRRHISYPKVRVVGGLGKTRDGNQIHRFKGLISACGENSGQGLSVILRGAVGVHHN